MNFLNNYINCIKYINSLKIALYGTTKPKKFIWGKIILYKVPWEDTYWNNRLYGLYSKLTLYGLYTLYSSLKVTLPKNSNYEPPKTRFTLYGLKTQIILCHKNAVSASLPINYRWKRSICVVSQS